MTERFSPRRNVTLEAAAAKLDSLATGVAPKNMLDRHRGRMHPGERRERLDQVRGQLGRLYNFFAETEGVRPTPADAARERYETMLGLLVHPLYDSALIEVVDTLDLPEGTAISLIGSGGNGVAQIRTLAAADVTLDSSPYKSTIAPDIGPDVDMTLISQNPVPESVRETYWDQAKPILTSHGLKPCWYFNMRESAYSTPELWENLTNGDEIELKPDDTIGMSTYTNLISAIFYPLYPKEQGNQRRKEMLGDFAELRETDNPKYEESRARIMRFMRRSYRLSIKHFGYMQEHMYDNLDFFDTDGLQEVRGYFGDRMMTIFADMFDMAEPPREGR